MCYTVTGCCLKESVKASSGSFVASLFDLLSFAWRYASLVLRNTSVVTVQRDKV